jgi:hypothetical protein
MSSAAPVSRDGLRFQTSFGEESLMTSMGEENSRCPRREFSWPLRRVFFSASERKQLCEYQIEDTYSVPMSPSFDHELAMLPSHDECSRYVSSIESLSTKMPTPEAKRFVSSTETSSPIAPTPRDTSAKSRNAGGASAALSDKKEHHHVSLKCRAAVQKFLFEHKFATVNGFKYKITCSGYKKTHPLHVAARKADTFMVKCLMEQGADPSLKDSKDRTALDVARQYNRNHNHAKVIGVLCKHDTDLFKETHDDMF